MDTAEFSHVKVEVRDNQCCSSRCQNTDYEVIKNDIDKVSVYIKSRRRWLIILIS